MQIGRERFNFELKTSIKTRSMFLPIINTILSSERKSALYENRDNIKELIKICLIVYRSAINCYRKSLFGKEFYKVKYV